MGQAPSLPDDAVADVLLRLAPRDIAASRRVCKSLRRSHIFWTPKPNVSQLNGHRPRSSFLCFHPRLVHGRTVHLIGKGTMPGMDPEIRRSCNERQSAYWRGSLYICCSNCFVMRISLSDNRYQVIKLPPPIFSKHGSRDRQQFYLGKSTKGIYCASVFSLYRSLLHVWFLNDLNEWVLKHDMDIFPILPNLDYGNRCDGPWILQQFDYHEHSDEDDSVVEDNREAIVEKEKSEAIVKQGKFEWDSDNDNVLEPGGRCETTDINFLGFHPFKEVVLLSLWNRVLAYHWSSSKLQDLGQLFIHSLRSVSGAFELGRVVCLQHVVLPKLWSVVAICDFDTYICCISTRRPSCLLEALQENGRDARCLCRQNI